MLTWVLSSFEKTLAFNQLNSSNVFLTSDLGKTNLYVQKEQTISKG